MEQANLDLWVFQETKVLDGVYTHASDGYHIIVSYAPICNCRGVDIFFWYAPHF